MSELFQVYLGVSILPNPGIPTIVKYRNDQHLLEAKDIIYIVRKFAVNSLLSLFAKDFWRVFRVFQNFVNSLEKRYVGNFASKRAENFLQI